MRERLPKEPERCDPHDPNPVAAYAGVIPELSIDDRVRQLVARMVGGLDALPEASPEDLRALEAMDGIDEVLSPHQMQVMHEEIPHGRVERFLKTLGPEDLRDLRRFLDEAAKPAAPPDGAGAGQSPAGAVGGEGPAT